MCNVGEAHRTAANVADDHRQVIGCGLGLIIGLNLPAMLRVLDRTFWAIGVAGDDGGAHVFEAEAELVELGQVEFDAYGRQCTAANRHLPHAFDLRQFLRQHGGGGVVHLPARQSVRRETEDHDRRVGRVDLAVGRVVRQRRGENCTRRIDCGLHIARGAVDVAVEIELQGHTG